MTGARFRRGIAVCMLAWAGAFGAGASGIDAITAAVAQTGAAATGAAATDAATTSAATTGAATTGAAASTAPTLTPSLTGILTEPADRERYQQLAEELRCLVCQNQTLADSGAELALDLRHQVESMIAAGQSNDEIKRYLVERYGDFVLYRPPVQRNTLALWGMPFALLAVGAFAWWRVQRRSRPEPVNESNVERARRLLDD
ncbi:MAG: cytochrome c-type biogenesis protein CcmH [Burkholderiaceae bacterium]